MTVYLLRRQWWETEYPLGIFSTVEAAQAACPRDNWEPWGPWHGDEENGWMSEGGPSNNDDMWTVVIQPFELDVLALKVEDA